MAPLKTNINRRQFLAGLAGLGAAVVLPDDATAAQIDEAWTRLAASPWYFDVDKYGTIVEPDVHDTETRADIWDDIRTSSMKTPSELISAVQELEPLRDHLRSLASDQREEFEYELEEDDSIRLQLADEDDEEERDDLSTALMDPARRALLEHQVNLLANERSGWKQWVSDAGVNGLPRFHAIIDDWLRAPPTLNDLECAPDDIGGQGKALLFFQDIDDDIAEELGVVIVEGEHTGSTYFAAELRNSVEVANEIAEGLGLPFRFRSASG